jgi:hypothetical protein
MKEQIIIFEKEKNELKCFLDLTVNERNTLSDTIKQVSSFILFIII